MKQKKRIVTWSLHFSVKANGLMSGYWSIGKTFSGDSGIMFLPAGLLILYLNISLEKGGGRIHGHGYKLTAEPCGAVFKGFSSFANNKNLISLLGHF